MEDAIDEDNETITVTLSNPINVTLNDHIGELTIADDDVAISTLSISDVVTANEAAVVNSATVTLSAASEKTVSVNFATSDGTATANNDYISASGTLEFAPGVITQTIPVTMVQDSLDEIDETITVTLSGESNATVADATGIITITDDDGTPTLSISLLTTVETGTLSATVSLSGASSEDVTVNYATKMEQLTRAMITLQQLEHLPSQQGTLQEQ